MYIKQHKSNGQAMVEFLIILPVMLLLVLGILQFGFIYQAKITLNYAAFEAARAGAMNNARQFAMQNALARALAPLYTNDDTVAEYKEARDIVRQQIANGLVQIDVINPSEDSFSDFGTTVSGQQYIANDNLIYRGATVGNDSNQTIQDANLLKIQTYYCYKMIVPFVNRIIWLMMRYSSTALPANEPLLGRQARFGEPETGSFNSSCVKDQNDADDDFYGIPIRSQAVMRMHSNAIFEP